MVTVAGDQVDTARGGAWCILRTNGSRTLPLVQSLAGAGVEAWTPVRTATQRVPRSKVTRDVAMPIMPTFVFARASHLEELRRCLSLPSNPHPPFSIFQHTGRVPLVSDRSLEGLRSEEQRKRPKDKRVVFPLHSRVRVPEGPFGGMAGIVEQSDGRMTLVCFGGRLSVKIETFLLREDAVQGAPQPEQSGNAA